MDGLTTSLIAWKQFESGLTEFKEALGKDKGALKGLTGALEMGNDTGDALTIDVKEVAKRLSEKIENQQQQQQQQVNFFLSLSLNLVDKFESNIRVIDVESFIKWKLIYCTFLC